MNGGNCTQIGNDFNCTCPQFFDGPTCQSCKLNSFNQLILLVHLIYKFFCLDLNPCASNPCLNGGNCSATSVSNFSCECDPLYSGGNCEFSK